MGIDPIKQQKQPAVFLDRDGVLNQALVRNRKPFPPPSVDDVVIPDEVPPALAALSKAGFLLIGVTNQPDVARGTQKKEVVEAINKLLMASLPVENIFVCYHDDPDGCDCRKPLPGLLLQASEKYAIHLPTSFMIGDRWKDIEAGRQAGCRTILLQREYAEKIATKPDLIASKISEAVDWILDQREQDKGQV